MRPILEVAPVRDKPKLLDLVRDVIRRKHYSIRTGQVYVDWIRRYILFHRKRHPEEMSEGEIAQFLTHLEISQERRREKISQGAVVALLEK